MDAMDDSSKKQFRELWERARGSMTATRFWITVTASMLLGVLIASPIALLLLFHSGPWTGFLWDLLFRLPFVLLCLFMVIQLVMTLRSRQFKEAGQMFLFLAFFGTITTIACYGFIRQISFLAHLHSLPARQLRTVSVACHSTDNPATVAQIAEDLRGAQWYSPDSHGWAPYAALRLEFTDGHREEYALTKILADGRLVVRLPGKNTVLLAVPDLRAAMEAAGLLQVATYPRYDNKGVYEALAPSSVCGNEATNY
jgi:hypothetical protein